MTTSYSHRPAPRAPAAPGGERYRTLAVLCLCFGLYHASRQILPPALSVIQGDLGLSDTDAGLAAGAFDLGYSLVLLLGGYLGDRFRRGPIIAAGLLWLALSLALTTLARDLTALALARLLTGLAFGFYFAPALGLLADRFPPRERGKAYSIHTGLGAGWGRVAAPLAAGLTLQSLGWAPLFLATAVLAALAAALAWRALRESGERRAPERAFGTMLKQTVASPHLLWLGVINAAVIACITALYTFLPLLLVRHGFTPGLGGMAVALLNGANLLVVPIYGMLSDRLGRKPVMTVLSLLAVLPLLGLPFVRDLGSVLAVTVLTGLLVGTPFAIVMTYAADHAPTGGVGIAVGYVNTFTVLGAGLSPLLMGAISDRWGVEFVFPTLAVLSLLTGAAFWLYRPPAGAASPREARA